MGLDHVGVYQAPSQSLISSEANLLGIYLYIFVPHICGGWVPHICGGLEEWGM